MRSAVTNRKWSVAIGALVAVALGVWLMTDRSTDTATAPARSPEGDALAVVDLPDELSAKAQVGQRAFEAKCASCHGVNAVGQDGVAPPLVHKIYEPGHHGDMAFVLAAQNGVRSHHWRFGNMPPVEGLTRGDVMNIVAYVRELQRANGIN